MYLHVLMWIDGFILMEGVCIRGKRLFCSLTTREKNLKSLLLFAIMIKKDTYMLQNTLTLIVSESESLNFLSISLTLTCFSAPLQSAPPRHPASSLRFIRFLAGFITHM